MSMFIRQQKPRHNNSSRDIPCEAHRETVDPREAKARAASTALTLLLDWQSSKMHAAEKRFYGTEKPPIGLKKAGVNRNGRISTSTNNGF